MGGSEQEAPNPSPLSPNPATPPNGVVGAGGRDVLWANGCASRWAYELGVVLGAVVVRGQAVAIARSGACAFVQAIATCYGSDDATAVLS
jgi:hypothetical protein